MLTVHNAERTARQNLDVGIAEQHAVTFSQGWQPRGSYLIALSIHHSSESYDQVVHDVALQNLHVIFCKDREE
jgi:1-deoxy-D-xylulose-5-phosphate synthase